MAIRENSKLSKYPGRTVGQPFELESSYGERGMGAGVEGMQGQGRSGVAARDVRLTYLSSHSSFLCLCWFFQYVVAEGGGGISETAYL